MFVGPTLSAGGEGSDPPAREALAAVGAGGTSSLARKRRSAQKVAFQSLKSDLKMTFK